MGHQPFNTTSPRRWYQQEVWLCYTIPWGTRLLLYQYNRNPPVISHSRWWCPKKIYLGGNRFNFFIPLPEKHTVRCRRRSNQQMHDFNDDAYLWTIHINPNYENQFLVTFLPSNLLLQHHFHFVNSWPFIHLPLGINILMLFVLYHRVFLHQCQQQILDTNHNNFR